jgi:hypothetical protein
VVLTRLVRPSAVDDSTPASILTSARSGFWTVATAWIVSRAISIGVLLVALDDPVPSRFTQLTEKWDGLFYLVIAREGYGPVEGVFPRWPFSPGFPALIRVIGELGSDATVIFVVNQLAFLVALLGLYCLARRHASAKAAALAVWAIALFPASFVFSMTYPSSLFLAASVWGFLLVEMHHDISASVCVAAAAILRPNGIVVAAALVIGIGSLRRAAVVCGPAVGVILLWCWYCYDRTGDALVFVTTKASWHEITLWAVVTGRGQLAAIPHGVLAVVAIALVVSRRKAFPRSWLAYTGLYLLPSLVTGIAGLGRYANECFPPFVAAGQLLERRSRPLVVLILACSTAGLCVFAFLAARTEVVP